MREASNGFELTDDVVEVRQARRVVDGVKLGRELWSADVSSASNSKSDHMASFTSGPSTKRMTNTEVQ